ncbi:MAG: ABC transporter ATP-binding protein [Acidimicrobiales bacterium]|nr:ABC transporter ATP-binding protein [Acidimicrobiales bacterium]
MLTALLRRILKPYRSLVALVVVLVALQAGASLYLPNLNADIINYGVIKGNMHYIYITGAWMLLITIGIGIVAITAVYFASKVSMAAGADMRELVFKKAQNFSAHEMNEIGTPSLITRNTNDIQQVQLFLQMALTLMVMAPVMSLGGVFMAIREGARLSLLLLVSVPAMAIVITLVLVLVVPLFRSMQVKIDKINQVLREQITGVRVIRAFVKTKYEEDRFAGANSDLTNTALRVNRIFSLTLPSLMVILNLSSVAVIWFGGKMVSEGSLPIGNLTAFLTYILQILMAGMLAVMMAVLVPRAVASAERILEVVNKDPIIKSPRAPKLPVNLDGEVHFEGVSFGYPGSELPVLSDLTFSIVPGATTAIIGGTGSGKTTLLNLIPRFFDATSGKILVNGVDVKEQDLDVLWSGIGLIPQNAYLFSGTVKSNLTLGKPNASDDEIWRALEIAQARDFVEAYPDGLETKIDQGGTNVSGGQRQRLSIARAIVRMPKLLLFDDCFSALDATTDANLRKALKNETKESAVIIIAQRVNTIIDASKILVLDEGRVIASGVHDDLKRSCQQYREIVISQLGQEALA